MAETLYPVFDVSTITEGELQDQAVEFKPDFLFDFDVGDFVMSGAKKISLADGWTAWKQWCIKQASITRFALLGYNDDAGIETDLIRDQTTRAAQENIIEKTITEALMIDRRTMSVSDFIFTSEGDSMQVEFTVTPSQGADLQLQLILNLNQ